MNFLWFRLARVYPVHLGMLVLFAVLALLGNVLVGNHLGSYPVKSLPFQLTMTHAWIVVHTYQWNYPSWSISAEWFAYLLMFPVSVWLLRQKWLAKHFILIGSSLLLAWVVLFIGHDGEMFWRYGAVTRVGLEFLAGSAFYGVFRQGSGIVRFCQKWCSSIFCVLLALLVVTQVQRTCWLAGAALLFIPLIILGLTAEKSRISRMLASPLALFAGRVSYSLYMSHAFSEKLLRAWLPSQDYAASSISVRVGVLLANAALISALAIGLYFLVEIPARTFMRRLVKR